MSRRFSDEPINLIHRILTPEQLSAARPVKRPFGQVLLESGAACIRSIADLFCHAGKAGRGGKTLLNDSVNPQPVGVPNVIEPIIERRVVHDEISVPGLVRAASVEGPAEGDEPTAIPASAPTATVQPEEVAELRSYLLAQQQDIARLSAQIQELRSMVVSQQQVLVYMGKEMEGAQASMSGVASGPGKRGRAVRDKAYMKDKTATRKDVQNPSLSL